MPWLIYCAAFYHRPMIYASTDLCGGGNYCGGCVWRRVFLFYSANRQYSKASQNRFNRGISAGRITTIVAASERDFVHRKTPAAAGNCGYVGGRYGNASAFRNRQS